MGLNHRRQPAGEDRGMSARELKERLAPPAAMFGPSDKNMPGQVMAGNRFMRIDEGPRVNAGICKPGGNLSSLGKRVVPSWFQAAKIGFFMRVGGMEPHKSISIDKFNEQINFWRPRTLARILKSVGASYVVLAAKHKMSFALWPTQSKNSTPPANGIRYPSALRDIVGEVTLAVREVGMEVGLYCGGDVSQPYPDTGDWHLREMLYDQLHELINWYRPALLWNNYGWPGEFTNKSKRLGWTFVDYFQSKCAKGVVNSRFFKQDEIKYHAKKAGQYHGDYTTVKYIQTQDVPPRTYEYMSSLQGLTVNEAAWRVADVAGKGGSLMFELNLFNDGSFPENMMANLKGLGVWVSYNAEAIKGTRPFLESGAQLQRDVRLTLRKEDQRAFAIIRPEAFDANDTVLIDHPAFQDPSLDVELLTPLGPELVNAAPGGRWQLMQSAIKPLERLPLVLAFRPQIRFLRPWPDTKSLQVRNAMSR